jgi:hypothetical protein
MVILNFILLLQAVLNLDVFFIYQLNKMLHEIFIPQHSFPAIQLPHLPHLEETADF